MRRAVCLGLILWLAGCTTAALVPAPDGGAIELAGVPFFPQSEYQCGPAALATALASSGVDTVPDRLEKHMYLPGRRGSLQAELVSVARQNGRTALPVAPTPQGLIDELEAGNPVLILQNLGIDALPRWHYAVVIGYEPESERWILRSGVERRRLEHHGGFMRRWDKAGHWGLVVNVPGQLPASISADQLLASLADSETRLPPDQAFLSWDAAQSRWPDNDAILFAAANAARAADKQREAAVRYTRLLQRSPHFVAAAINLADLLLESGCATRAERVLSPSLESPEALDGVFGDALRQTASELRAAPRDQSCGLLVVVDP